MLIFLTSNLCLVVFTFFFWRNHKLALQCSAIFRSFLSFFWLLLFLYNFRYILTIISLISYSALLTSCSQHTYFLLINDILFYTAYGYVICLCLVSFCFFDYSLVIYYADHLLMVNLYWFNVDQLLAFANSFWLLNTDFILYIWPIFTDFLCFDLPIWHDSVIITHSLVLVTVTYSSSSCVVIFQVSPSHVAYHHTRRCSQS